MTLKFKSAADLKDAIVAWEYDAGEGFTDYFMDGAIVIEHWTQFLRDKGFDKRAQEILYNAEVKKTQIMSLDQELLFHPNLAAETWMDDSCGYKRYECCEVVEYHQDSDKWDYLYQADLLLMAQFLFNDERYHEDIQKFLDGEDE